jgi:hypothetical protein
MKQAILSPVPDGAIGEVSYIIFRDSLSSLIDTKLKVPATFSNLPLPRLVTHTSLYFQHSAAISNSEYI